MGSKKKAKPSRSKKKTKTSADQALALDYVRAWAHPAAFAPPPDPSAADAGDAFLPPQAARMACGGSGSGSVLFELHSHSNHSDGFLSPSALVERAHRNGVKVLSLTDHDTMAGIPEAVSAARKFGIRIIPGVEISALYSPREIAGAGEPVHILAYYGMCGPSRFDELDSVLLNIRGGRYLRAKNMLAKLNRLKVSIKWEHVTKIAGEGVAPGRLHIARAMVEAGYVENVRQAFNKYIGDDGPAYAIGSEPFAETVVQLISRTGGISALAHPWALKNPDAIIRALKGAGLNAMEVYRSDGKVDGFSELAEKYGLLKLGGSDFHGRGGKDEYDIGTVKLAITTLCSFLKISRPIWCGAMKDILLKFAEEPSAANLRKIVKFGQLVNSDGFSPMDSGMDVVNLCLSSWLSNDDMEDIELEEVKVLSLTNHDTMAGIPEAVSAAHKFGIRIIPGVEISALYSPRYAHNNVPLNVAPYLNVDPATGNYYPTVFFSEFLLLRNKLIALNETVEELPLNLEVGPISMTKWQLFLQIEQSFQVHRSYGSMLEGEVDKPKRVFLEGNPYLLGLTMVVSLLHSLFDFLAFKNNIQFWNKNRSMEGLSAKSVVLQLKSWQGAQSAPDFLVS